MAGFSLWWGYLIAQHTAKNLVTHTITPTHLSEALESSLPSGAIAQAQDKPICYIPSSLFFALRLSVRSKGSPCQGTPYPPKDHSYKAFQKQTCVFDSAFICRGRKLTHLLVTYQQHPGLGQAGTRTQESHSALPHGWQGPNQWPRDSVELPPRVLVQGKRFQK